MSEVSRPRRISVGRTRGGCGIINSEQPPPFGRAKQVATVALSGSLISTNVKPATASAMASIAGELCLLTMDRKLIPVKAKVLSHCDLDSAYAGRQMLPVSMGCHQSSCQMALQVDEGSRLIEKLLALLEVDADDASGQQLQARLTDSRGILKRGLEPWLFPLLSVADRWGARHIRDLLVSAFVDNVERVLQPTPTRHVNPFATLSGGVLKALLLPLLQRASGDQLKRVLDLLRECQSSVHSVNGSSGMSSGGGRVSCIPRREINHGDYDGMHTELCGEKRGKADRIPRVDRVRDRSAQDALALRKVTDLIEDRLDEFCSH